MYTKLIIKKKKTNRDGELFTYERAFIYIYFNLPLKK